MPDLGSEPRVRALALPVPSCVTVTTPSVSPLIWKIGIITPTAVDSCETRWDHACGCVSNNTCHEVDIGRCWFDLSIERYVRNKKYFNLAVREGTDTDKTLEVTEFSTGFQWSHHGYSYTLLLQPQIYFSSVKMSGLLIFFHLKKKWHYLCVKHLFITDSFQISLNNFNSFFFFLRNWRSFIYLFIYFWLCWVFVSVRGLSLVAASGDHSSSRCAGLSPSRPLLLRSTGSRRAGSVIVAHGPSCSVACEIFPDQGSNPCPLHWQADSQPLRHHGSPVISILAPKF